MNAQEKLIEALGRVDEKYIENSADFTARAVDESAAVTGGLKEITVPAVNKKKPPKFLKWAVGAAAALALVGGALFVWMNIRDTIGIGGQDVVITLPSDVTVPPVPHTEPTNPEPSVSGIKELTIPAGRVTKTFDIGYEGNVIETVDSMASYFDNAAATDGAGYKFMCVYPFETFMSSIAEDSELSDAYAALGAYSDADKLSYEKITEELAKTEVYPIFEDHDIGSEYGGYRLNDEYIIYIDDGLNVRLFRKDEYYTACRRAVEIMWANYDLLKPITVTAVSEPISEIESRRSHWLKITAENNTLALIKKTLGDNGIPADNFEFVGLTYVQPEPYDLGTLEKYMLGLWLGMKYEDARGIMPEGGKELAIDLADGSHAMTVTYDSMSLFGYDAGLTLSFEPRTIAGEEKLVLGSILYSTPKPADDAETISIYTDLYDRIKNGLSRDPSYSADGSYVEVWGDFNPALVIQLSLGADTIDVEYRLRATDAVEPSVLAEGPYPLIGEPSADDSEDSAADDTPAGQVETVKLPADDNSYGITLEAKDVTQNAMTVVFRHSGGTLKGALAYFSEYHIKRYIADDVWKPLMENPTMWDPVPTPITVNVTIERRIKFDAPLADGKYKVELKLGDVSDFTENCTRYSTKTCELEFEVTGSSVQLSDMELDLSGYPYAAIMPDEAQMPTFRLQERFITDHEGNPGERSALFTGWESMTADGTVFSQMTVEIDAESAYRELSRYMGDESDVSELASYLEPYTDENGDLLYERFSSVSKVKMYDPTEPDEWYNTTEDFMISENWIISFHESEGERGMYILKKDYKLTAFRKALAELWAGYERFPTIAVVAVCDHTAPYPYEDYLEVIAESDVLAVVKSYLDEKGIDTSGMKFVTPAEERASYLPVTQIVEVDGTIYKDHYDSPYYVAINNGARNFDIYGCEFPLDFSPKAAAEHLKELGYSAEAQKLLGMKTSASGKTIDKAELEKLGTPLVNSDIFDLVTFGEKNRNTDTFRMHWYNLSANVVLASEDGVDGYSLWINMPDENSKTFYTEQEIVRFFRKYPKVRDIYQNDGTSKDYTIKSIEIVHDGSEKLKEIRVIADKDEWDTILSWVKYESSYLDTSLITFAEEPTDLTNAKYMEWN